MSDLSEQERETLHHIVNEDTSVQLSPDHVAKLQSLGYIEQVGDAWKATAAGRTAGIPRPEHL